MKTLRNLLLAATTVLFTLFGTSCKKEIENIIDLSTFKIVCPTGADKLELGEQIQLGIKFRPENATIKGLVWTSDQPEVASVNENGIVTALTQGTANITVSISQGDKKYEDSITIEVLGDLKITNYELLKGVYWGSKHTFTAGNISDGAEREVTWNVEFPDVTDPENCGTTIDPDTGELNAMPKTVDNQVIYDNYKVKIIATAKDNGSIAEKIIDCQYWKAIVMADNIGNEAPADHIFRRGEDINISYTSKNGALRHDFIEKEMTIAYNTAKLRHYQKEIWKIHVLNNAPAGPETVTVKLGDYQQSFTINIESTEASAFSIKANSNGAFWGESIQFTAQNGTVSKWEILRPKPEKGKEVETHISEIDNNGKLTVKEYVKAKLSSNGHLSTTNIFRNSNITVKATSTDNKTATATIQSYYWKILVYWENGDLHNPNDNNNVLGVGDIITVKIKDDAPTTPGLRPNKWIFSAPTEAFQKKDANHFELIEGGSANDYYVTATLGSVTQTYSLGQTTL